jgi:hypothetical protein
MSAVPPHPGLSRSLSTAEAGPLVTGLGAEATLLSTPTSTYDEHSAVRGASLAGGIARCDMTA